jgi:hypothetical protein
MPKNPRTLLALALALAALAAVLAAVLWLGSWRAPTPSCRLPDGTIATLEAVTYGREKRVRGSFWQQLLYAVLPEGHKQGAGHALLLDLGPSHPE